MVRFIANLHVKKVCACRSSSPRQPYIPLQVDKTPTPDPDIRRWPFLIKPSPNACRTPAAKDSLPPPVKVEPRFISREEVARHNSASSAFVILDSKVYDVTTFAPHHPGTAKILMLRAGTDASDAFFAFHPPRVRDNYLQVAALTRCFPLSFLTPPEISSACTLAGASPWN